MTTADLNAIATQIGAADIPELFNNYVKNIALVSGKVIEIITDYDYKAKKPRGIIYHCAGMVGNLIRLVPAFDYFCNRHFESLYVDPERIALVLTLDQSINKYRQAYIAKLKQEIGEGKFVNRDTGRIIGADEVEAQRTYPSTKE